VQEVFVNPGLLAHRTRVADAGFIYWTSTLIIAFICVVGSPYVYNLLHLTELRSRYFQALLELGPRPPEPRFVSIALIQDDEYRGDELAGRNPLKRDYLAKMIDTVAAQNAYLIAIDVDMRLPDPTSMKIPESYKQETEILIGAIRRAASAGKKIVLANSIWRDETGKIYQDPDIYQAHGMCRPYPGSTTAADPDAQQSRELMENIVCGHIALPGDPLVIPIRVPLARGGYLNSFAFAIARVLRPELMSRLEGKIGDEARYGNYISSERFQEFQALVSARALLQGTVAKRQLEARAVIIGGDWSTFAAGRGRRVDVHPTPVGPIVGAVLHANFVEALLDSRTFKFTSVHALHVTELVFSLLVALIFVLIRPWWAKVASLVPLLVSLLLIQWMILHGFGLFFDAFVPLLGLGLHSLYERVIGIHQQIRPARARRRARQHDLTE
jgi:CHASE2 domain-containing sensor protein